MTVLYATGDSHTFGVGLPGHDPYTRTVERDIFRYPTIVGQLLKAELVINTGRPSGSNQRIVRKISDDIPQLVSRYGNDNIHVLVGFTTPARFEVFHNGAQSYFPLRYGHESKHNSATEQLWRLYTAHVYDEQVLVDQFRRDVLCVKSILDCLGVTKYLLFRTTMPNTPGLELKLQEAGKQYPNTVGKVLELPAFSQWAKNAGFTQLPCLHFDHTAHRSWAAVLYEKLTNQPLTE